MQSSSQQLLLCHPNTLLTRLGEPLYWASHECHEEGYAARRDTLLAGIRCSKGYVYRTKCRKTSENAQQIIRKTPESHRINVRRQVLTKASIRKDTEQTLDKSLKHQQQIKQPLNSHPKNVKVALVSHLSVTKKSTYHVYVFTTRKTINCQHEKPLTNLVTRALKLTASRRHMRHPER